MVRLASKKGGVGKTVISVNLAAALAAAGKKVLLVDGDASNANIAIHLGLEGFVSGFSELLLKKLDAEEVIIGYKDGKFDVIPCRPYIGVYAPTPDQIMHVGMQISNFDYDFIVVDTPPGFFSPSLAPYYSESLVVSTPDLSSLSSDMTLVNLCRENNLAYGVLLNKVGEFDNELKKEEINEMYKIELRDSIPYDKIVYKSIVEKKPAYMLDNSSAFSIAIDKLAKRYIEMK